MTKLGSFSLSLILFFFLCGFSYGVEPDEILENNSLEKRARVISSELRCLVCRNENIDSSEAELAKDLRVLVRERLSMGETNEAVIKYIHERYGDYVLLKPRFSGNAIILWLFAPLLFFLGLLITYLTLFQKNKMRFQDPQIKPLTDQEQKEVKRFLEH